MKELLPRHNPELRGNRPDRYMSERRQRLLGHLGTWGTGFAWGWAAVAAGILSAPALPVLGGFLMVGGAATVLATSLGIILNSVRRMLPGNR